MFASGVNTPLRATNLAVSDLAAILRRAGSRHIAEEALRADLAAGAPVNPDGTVNLVHYTAWLAKEASNGD